MKNKYGTTGKTEVTVVFDYVNIWIYCIILSVPKNVS